MLLKGREILQSGETIRLLGLSILYLKGFLFCFSDFGTLRISLFEEERPALETGRREQFLSLIHIFPLHILASLKRVFVGYFLACIIGIPLGILMGCSKTGKAIVKPIFELLRPIPGLAWIPLAILWFGIGETSKYFIICVSAIVSIILKMCIRDSCEGWKAGLCDLCSTLYSWTQRTSAGQKGYCLSGLSLIHIFRRIHGDQGRNCI